MARQRHPPEQIITKLRKARGGLGAETVGRAGLQGTGVAEQTYYPNWRKKMRRHADRLGQRGPRGCWRMKTRG